MLSRGPLAYGVVFVCATELEHYAALLTAVTAAAGLSSDYIKAVSQDTTLAVMMPERRYVGARRLLRVDYDDDDEGRSQKHFIYVSTAVTINLFPGCFSSIPFVPLLPILSPNFLSFPLSFSCREVARQTSV